MLGLALVALASLAAAACTTERAALETIYDSMGGVSWNTNNWLQNDDICTWTGVTCNAGGAVVALDLTGMNLVGQIPDDLSCLTNLKSLYLNNNDLGSTIPDALCTMTSLQYFQAQHAGLTGEIPTCICNMPFMQYFYVNNNALTGSIPTCVAGMTFLREMHLNCNALSGEVPAGFSELAFLEELYVNCNTDIICPDGVFPAPGVIFLCGDVFCENCELPSVQCADCVDIPNCGTYCRTITP